MSARGLRSALVGLGNVAWQYAPAGVPQRATTHLEAYRTMGIACVAGCDPDAEAARIGAVNTLYVEAGRWLGTNTDRYGFARQLDESGLERVRHAIVVGAGGAARGRDDAPQRVHEQPRAHVAARLA